LLRDFPAVARYQREALQVRAQIGDLLGGTGRTAEAAKAYAAARSLGQRFTADDPVSYGTYAWFLASCPDPAFRDAPLAIRMAKQLLERLPEIGPLWLTLGVGHYHAGDYPEAVRTLGKEARLPTGQSSTGGFYLALAHWQLGHPD